MTPTKGDAMSRLIFGIAPKTVLPAFPIGRFGREVAPPVQHASHGEKVPPEIA